LDGIFTETWPVELVVKLPWIGDHAVPYQLEGDRRARSWRRRRRRPFWRLKRGHGDRLTRLRTGGICASWDRSTGDAPSCGAMLVPPVEVRVLRQHGNAGEVDAE
jgi:hypothetical protein